jgi:hypothetical protein
MAALCAPAVFATGDIAATAYHGLKIQGLIARLRRGIHSCGWGRLMKAFMRPARLCSIQATGNMWQPPRPFPTR